MIRFSQLESITGGRFLRLAEDRVITTLQTDSRKAVDPDGSVFFAIQGSHHDGHRYVADLYKRGFRQFVVEREPDLPSLPEADVLLVESSLRALQSIAGWQRSQFTIPVVGITGSNGKTIVKEWLFQLLSRDYKIVKNPGSYNSQLGVPLSVWAMQPHHELGIFEAGISRPGEMERLSEVIRPTIGIFTNIGSAHDEGFGSRGEKVLEKLRLFESCKVVIYCKDHKTIDEAMTKSGLTGLSWGASSTAGIQVKSEEGQFVVSFKGTSFRFRLPFSDKASVENCFHCVTLMMHLGYSPEEIQERILSLQAIPMRLELKEGINQSQVIDDTYNNDLAGLQITLDFLSNQHQKNRKRVILSDILESGLPDDALTREIASMLSKNHVQSFVGIGPVLYNHKHLFQGNFQFYPDTDAFIQNFDWDSIQHEVVLVKGARRFQFEKIVEKLQRKVHGTVMEIDLGAVVHNLNFFRARLKPETKIMVMVKAFAYGSGSTEIANLLQYHKVDYLGVAYADEGTELRKNNISIPIMVMNPSEESFGTLLQYNLEPEIYNFRLLQQYIAFLRQRTGTIHIKLDTGMHRLGFEESEIDALAKILRENPFLKIASVFSHMAGADEAAHDAFSKEQFEKFRRGARRIEEAVGYKPIYHILNSPGILRLPDYQLDMVRLGIGLYGVNPTDEKIDGLRPVATLKTIVSQVKTISAGDTIGYGRRGKADRPMEIATIAIGYADGFSRAFSRGAGTVLVNGKPARTVGNVCMDMTMIDVTGMQVHEGDEVIIFGGEHPIQAVAASIQTIPYEILTSTSERVKRVFVAESI